VEVAEGEELADIATADCLASKAGTACNSEARQGELEKILNPRGLLGGLPMEESHDDDWWIAGSVVPAACRFTVFLGSWRRWSFFLVCNVNTGV